jgi:hypothetical protein
LPDFAAEPRFSAESTMALAAKFFRWHRWLGYAVALQVLAWLLGGLLFAWVPFKAWVKGGDAVAKVQQPLPAGWAQALGTTVLRGPVLSVQSVATAAGPALRLRGAAGDQWLAAAGGELPAPSAESIAQFARSLYRGSGVLAAVQRLPEAPTRLAMVQEVAGRQDLWLARFDDGLQTRLYFDGRSGELLAVRNEAWVLYDFFWRLHVMDYAEGEDFNNTLLRICATLAMGLVLTGLVLTTLALRRAWRRR